MRERERDGENIYTFFLLLYSAAATAAAASEEVVDRGLDLDPDKTSALHLPSIARATTGWS